MPEFFLELFSEEIPARMQAGAAETWQTLMRSSFAPLTPTDIKSWYGPRRIAVAAQVQPGVLPVDTTERGPRLSAPNAAVEGFLRKHGASRDQLRAEGDYYLLEKRGRAIAAAELIAAKLPELLRGFAWPKSMRWGGSSLFTWVRPLRRITALLDGAIVPFDLRDGGDDGHGLAAANVTEGHRFMAPGPVAVAGAAHWLATLRDRHVLADAAERRQSIAEGLAAQAAALGLSVVADAGLLDEVANLVEWPVPLLGRIDAAYMDLPAEVMQVSMRVNQRYFALRDAGGAAAPWFGFAANILAPDGGAAIIAGNERVLRARFADARYFWDLDRQTRLADRVAALDGVTFHARLGSQGARAARLQALAFQLAGPSQADPALAERAARLAKADLTTGMVGEFPELQGVMGAYYAAHDGEPPEVAAAIRAHYSPKGPADAVPAAPVSVAVALADKIDLLTAFFAIGERPSGSGDPYALRRAALGIIRIVTENKLRLPLRPAIQQALAQIAGPTDGADPPPLLADVFEFIVERLRVQLRADGARHDVLSAVFAAGADDDLTRLLARTAAVAALLDQPAGANLLAAYRRAANILRIEDRKDGPHDAAPDPGLFALSEETALAEALDRAEPAIDAALAREEFSAAMAAMAALRAPIDDFFDKVTVNAEPAVLRRNRLSLLRRITRCMHRVADFSRIES